VTWTLRRTVAIGAAAGFVALCAGAVNAAHTRYHHRFPHNRRSTRSARPASHAATNCVHATHTASRTSTKPAGTIDRAAHDRSQYASAYTVPALSRGENIARTALAYRGVAYRFGGRSAQSGFDCSGLVQTVCAKWGIYLPRVAGAQFARGVRVKPWQLQPGDLVFFQGTYKRGLSHVGIFIGQGQFVHAAGRGQGVRISKLSDSYNQHHWAGARRLDLSRLPKAPHEAPVIASQVNVDGAAPVTAPTERALADRSLPARSPDERAAGEVAKTQATVQTDEPGLR
jgi:cell wall-associated NlpC family hydrolase